MHLAGFPVACKAEMVSLASIGDACPRNKQPYHQVKALLAKTRPVRLLAPRINLTAWRVGIVDNENLSHDLA